MYVCNQNILKIFYIPLDGAVSPKQTSQLKQGTPGDGCPQMMDNDCRMGAVATTLNDGNRSSTGEDYGTQQSDDVFSSQLSSLPDIRTSIPLRMVSLMTHT